MKYSVVGIIILAFVGLLAMKPAQKSEMDDLREEYFSAMEQLVAQAKKIESASAWKEKKAAYRELRRQYKLSEVWIGYFAPQEVAQVLNPAPLPTVDEKEAFVSVLSPQGLQTLEESICEAEDENKTNALAVQFSNHMKHLMQLHQSRVAQFDITVLLNAYRMQLIRMLTLGQSGYDTPCMSDFQQDMQYNWQSMGRLLMALPQAVGLQQMDWLHTLGQSLLAERKFSQTEFTREVLLPLYAVSGKYQKQHGGVFPEELTASRLAVNWQSEQVFDPAFFNLGYFTQRDVKSVDYPKQVALGKLLFYDPILSSNNKRACASCHMPNKHFSDGFKKSIALDFSGTVDRNAPTLHNAVLATKFFHDVRAVNLAQQIENVVTNPKEFNTDYNKVVEKLNHSTVYKSLFQDAFGGNINKNHVNEALAAYMSSLVSFQSEFDKYMRKEIDDIDASVKKGFDLFMGKALCGTCHFAPNFNGVVPPLYTETETEVLGVPLDYEKGQKNVEFDEDLGRFVSGNQKDLADFYKYSFKTPTVRNVAETAPYMHNGGMKTLADVVEFYNVGGGAALGFDLPHQTLPFDKLSLFTAEKENLVKFMQALTDTSLDTSIPSELPVMDNSEWNKRKVGGEY